MWRVENVVIVGIGAWVDEDLRVWGDNKGFFVLDYRFF